MINERKQWLKIWKEIESKYYNMHLFKFKFFHGKIKYYYSAKDKTNLVNQLSALNEVLVTHRERLEIFFENLDYDNFKSYKDKYIYNIFLSYAYSFINDAKVFWTLFDRVYKKDELLKENEIKISFEIFEIIAFLRKIVDHPVAIKLYNTNKDFLKNSKYLKCNFNIEEFSANNSKLYLTWSHIVIDEKKERPFLNIFIDTNGIFTFNNSFQYQISFEPKLIISDFLKYMNIYCKNIIKIQNILTKNKIKYLKKPKLIVKNEKQLVNKTIKHRIYDFNQKDSPFYDSKLINTWTFSIERKEIRISKQKKLRKKFILSYQNGKEKVIKDTHGIKSVHKGCFIGKLMDDFLHNDDKITLKNLATMNHYNIEQPDALLILVYIIIRNVNERHIRNNYVNEYWFLAIHGHNEQIKNIEDFQFPWKFITEYMPFDKRIINYKYRSDVCSSSYYE